MGATKNCWPSKKAKLKLTSSWLQFTAHLKNKFNPFQFILSTFVFSKNYWNWKLNAFAFFSNCLANCNNFSTLLKVYWIAKSFRWSNRQSHPKFFSNIMNPMSFFAVLLFFGIFSCLVIFIYNILIILIINFYTQTERLLELW